MAQKLENSANLQDQVNNCQPPVPNSSDSTTEDSFLLLSYLDEVDDRIEDIKRRARQLQHDRDSVMVILAQLQKDSSPDHVPNNESQDLQATIDNLRKRCEAVEIKIHTHRSPEQEAAISKVEALVAQLERVCILGDSPENSIDSHQQQPCEKNRDSYQVQAKCLLNACLSDCTDGAVDYKFQGLVLDCKLEDQKVVRHRLECLVKGYCHENYVESCIGDSHNLSQTGDGSSLNVLHS